MKERDTFPPTIAGFYLQISKLFWPYVASLIVLYTIFDVLNGVLGALTVKWLINGIESLAPGESLIAHMMPTIVTLAVLYFIMVFAHLTSNLIKAYYWPIIKARIGKIIFQRLGRQTIAYFKDNSAGFIVEQASYIFNKYNKIAIDHVNEIIALILAVIVNATLLFQVHWAIAALFGACAGMRLAHCAFNTKKLWQSNKRAARLGARVTSNYVDSVSNFMNVKLFARNNNETKYLDRVRHEHAKARQVANHYNNKFWMLPWTFEQFCMVGLAILCIRLYAVGLLDFGGIAFSFMSFGTMMRLIRDMTWKLPELTEDLTTVTQAYADISKPITITDAAHARCLNPKKCRIDFDDVSFKYKESGRIFKNMNLCIKPGEKVGIVGLSGSGKSTLLYLLMRLYDIDSGRILIDGADVKNVTQDSLRGHISFVPQECVLFNRTLAENISYGKPNATRADVIAAAKLASAHDFIMNMEFGYDTPVGDRGVKLSGGQRQRIAIARTICKDAPIIVMDEATSALDSKTEEIVQRSMKHVLHNRTALVVAHRLSTLRQMDRIIVLHHGKIAEQGSHSELIKKPDGIYAKLWSMQVDGFIK
ncbi:MAG: ABC transporter ATP-binding protein/permease [Alphaproteobacteria bacterium]|nr:ABC transporter ATP-binding protein/permease [Alphaproteobacteria bacterium]